ncbi:hypothetical protein J0B03_04155 [Alkalibacter rhizosphaerae]|uniref:Uncharacterized protein n=1 Tax=Alkalibacter rhizosphaerae TaxID=2815577 RepID=A0A975AJ20_9FIRM|nr:hypothetical protein [Alkalibacter rhizosphaerae]QSX09264.1 hypothetical protein J0B03_04155 [Alkalibacter rhizosphaerae]
MLNLSKGMMAIGGFLPLAFLPDKEVTDFNRCPSWGTRNVKLTEVVHKKR